jgi:prolipoprotein diacylglyceryltransferase
MYLAWYGFGRMFIEGLRTDSLYVGPFRISQLIGFLCFVIFGGLIVAGLIYSKKLNEKEKLSSFDKILVPDLIMTPVFFEKTAEKTDKNAKNEKTDESETEEVDNGTDN